jgi:hypothetical protein
MYELYNPHYFCVSYQHNNQIYANNSKTVHLSFSLIDTTINADDLMTHSDFVILLYPSRSLLV